MPYIIVEGDFGIGTRLENHRLREDDKHSGNKAFCSRKPLFNRNPKQNYRTAVSGLKGSKKNYISNDRKQSIIGNKANCTLRLK